MKNPPRKRSPLRDRPLRLPGESLQGEADRLVEDRILYPVLLTLTIVILTALQWLYYLLPMKGVPWFATLVSVAAIIYTFVSVARSIPRLRSLQLARDGERIVAEQLDVLKQSGAAVFHDVLAGSFNIDHIIVSSKGIFVAETKTRSKPSRGSPSVVFDGKIVKVDGFEPDRDPVAQARMNAKWVSEQLRRSTGKTFAIRPVVLFPGWFVEPAPRGTDTWVLEPKALPAFISNEPTMLADEDVHLAAYHLSRMVRPMSDAA